MDSYGRDTMEYMAKLLTEPGYVLLTDAKKEIAHDMAEMAKSDEDLRGPWRR